MNYRAALISLVLFTAGCETDYHVTVAPQSRGESVSPEVHAQLSRFLISRGFDEIPTDKANEAGGIFGIWRKTEGKLTWLYGPAQLEVLEYVDVNKTMIVIAQYNGKDDVSPELAASIRNALDKFSPRYTVTLEKHVMYGPSWSKN
jgi:hypothetical protein